MQTDRLEFKPHLLPLVRYGNRASRLTYVSFNFQQKKPGVSQSAVSKSLRKYKDPQLRVELGTEGALPSQELTPYNSPI